MQLYYAQAVLGLLDRLVQTVVLEQCLFCFLGMSYDKTMLATLCV
jgi:hypothetical protein